MKRLLATLAALLVMTTLAPAPPQPETPELRPTLSVFRPAKDDEGAAEQAAVGEIVAANVTGDSRRGSFALGDASGDYEIILARGAAGRVVVEFRLAWTGKADALIASLGLRIPFDFGGDLRRTKIAVGSEGRPAGEVWRVDSNAMKHPVWMLGDREERWPLWRLGGIVQDASDHYRIWKANRVDTAPVVVDENRAAPGWLDVSGENSGVTVIWDEMPKRAPCAIAVNAPAGTIEVWFHPPSAAPRRAESLGLVPGKPATWTFTLAGHDDVFPATRPAGIPRAEYAELLRLVDAQKLWNWVADNFRVSASGDLDARIREAIDTGVAPSEVLRAFDSGDAWRMRRLCAAVGAPHTDDHAANVKAVLDYCAAQAKLRPKG